MTQVNKNIFYILMVLAMAGWGASWVNAKVLSSYVNEYEMIFLRNFFTIITLAPVLIITKKYFYINRHSLLLAVLASIIMIVYLKCYFLGTMHGTASLGGALVTTLIPINTFIFMALFFGKKILRKDIFALIIGGLGVLTMLNIWSFSHEQIFSTQNMYFLGASVLWPALTITSSKITKTSPMVFTLYMYIISTIMVSLFFVDFTAINYKAFDSIFWINLLVLSIISTTFATSVYFIGIEKLGTNEVSSFIFLVPFFAIILSIIFLGETVHLTTIIGVILTLFAVKTLNNITIFKKKKLNNNIDKNTNKLNTFTLSGLIIGPILGSGLILLPPLLYNMVGNFSLIVWAIILVLGFVFAIIFGKLAILYPGDGGVSLATKEAMGKKYQLLTSFYLICAVFFGPVAVLIIAAQFIQPYFPNVSLEFLGFFTYIITYLSLLTKIDFLGKIMLIVSSAITLIFLISSINIILSINEFHFSLPYISLKEFGHALIIVFWSIVGWEVIGNYSKEVEKTKTLTNAVKLSAIIISLVYILTTLAICFGEFPKDEEFKLVWIIQPVFKEFSNVILASVSTILCVGTLILFVGGVARLISSLKLTSYTSKHLKNNTPIGALNFLSMIYIITLTLVYFDILTLDNLVAYADGFFIANAIIGLITAIILFKKGFLKISAIILTILFGVILLFSNIFILCVIIGLFLFTYLKRSHN